MGDDSRCRVSDSATLGIEQSATAVDGSADRTTLLAVHRTALTAERTYAGWTTGRGRETPRRDPRPAAGASALPHAGPATDSPRTAHLPAVRVNALHDELQYDIRPPESAIQTS